VQQYVMQFELLAQRWKTSHTGVPDQTFDDNQLKEIARYPE
ncbi:hyaluronate lyase, partial [Yersinia pestis]